MGHVLVEVTATDGNFTICSRCGAFGSRKAVNLALECPGILTTRRLKESYSRVFKNGKHPRSNKPLTRSHFRSCGAPNVPTSLLRSEVDRSRRRRRLETKTKPWIAASFGIVEDPKDAVSECGDDEDPFLQEEEDPFGFNDEEEDPFGFNEPPSKRHKGSSDDLVQIGGSSSSEGPNASVEACLPACPVANLPSVSHSTSCDVREASEPVFKKPCTSDGVTAGRECSLYAGSVGTPVECTGTNAVDKWAAWQERKRRKQNSPLEPTVEGEFARLAKLAASEL